MHEFHQISFSEGFTIGESSGHSEFKFIFPIFEWFRDIQKVQSKSLCRLTSKKYLGALSGGVQYKKLKPLEEETLAAKAHVRD